MVKIILTIKVFLISLISLAQVSEMRDVSNFSKLKVSSGIEVFYTISDEKSVKVETDDNEKLKFIKTEVENGTLKLYIESNTYSCNGEMSKKGNWNNGINFKVLKITVFGPNLEVIKAGSSADVKFENTNTSSNLVIEASSAGSISGNFNCTNLTLYASSSGNFTGKVDATSVEIESSSAGYVNLSGKATKISVKANTASDCDLKNFTVEQATIRAGYSADVSIKVTKSIEAKASSTASIVYFGNPLEVKKEESSFGSVKSE